MKIQLLNQGLKEPLNQRGNQTEYKEITKIHQETLRH